MIGIAAVFGAIAIFAADYWLKSAASARTAEVEVAIPAPRIAFGTIVVAQKPLRYGADLDRDALAEISWPEKALPAGAFASIDGLLAQGGRVVLSPIEPNEPVLASKLSGPDGRATLSNLLSPGMRAVTIKTDEIAGVGGFVTPGDRVDIMLTRNAGQIAEVARAAEGASGSTVTSEIVLENVKVLTVGQGADERQTSPQVVNSVTVEVTVDGAQKIALARTVGSLSLSLRSAGEARTTEAGVMTISAFGGSVAERISQAVERMTAEEGPQFKTVIVTRGLEAQSYKVIAPEE
ncbi:Flp pilus assembly protein CpaB [Nitratireductor mangrovi]|uniref:Flp pilus assembly protein CpaB n=2 Tax=Nitratireductor mangrovi TaxID=2599600 RepID=A0A5B8L571_9HYPH|nr:Flp pilus assembly protein CpaB [Nitratireductor mangrovi]